MGFVRINISLPKEIFAELSSEVEPRKRSRFITEAVARFLKERRAQRLASEYKAAAEGITWVNQEIEGAISYGLE